MKNLFSKPRVFLVGAGPGDPELITLKGIRCLQKAQIVIYDYLASAKLLNYAPDAQKIYVGKKAGHHSMSQEEINKLLVEKASTGKIIVRLKGGDPFVFGRGAEECEALADCGISFEIVPGITAGIAAPCYSGIPVTHRTVASSVAFITGHEDPSKEESGIAWEYLSKGIDTLVFYMGVGNLALITEKLISNGKAPSTPVALIRWGTTPLQKTVTGTLESIVQIAAQQKIKPPAIIIVGEVISLSKKLSWFQNRPLMGKKIINTRSRHQASVLTEKLEELGAEVLELPTIEIKPVSQDSELDSIIKNDLNYDWLIFTSPNAVQIFFTKLLKTHGDIRTLGKTRIGCIGPATADAVREYHIKIDVVSAEAVAEKLVEALEHENNWENLRVLLPRAEEARDIVPQSLSNWGAHVDVITAYRTVPASSIDPAIIDDIMQNNYDLITFSSSSTFTSFVKLIGSSGFQKIRSEIKAASIGPVTSSTIRQSGVEPCIEADEHTIPGLVEAIERYLTK